MEVFRRPFGLGLMITALMCQPIAAQETPEASDDNPHQTDLDERQSLPLEELQMFADVFNQIREGYVESVPDSKHRILTHNQTNKTWEGKKTNDSDPIPEIDQPLRQGPARVSLELPGPNRTRKIQRN